MIKVYHNVQIGDCPCISDIQFNNFKVYILEQAIKRQQEVKVDTHLVQLFFETFEDFEREQIEEIHAENGKKIEIPMLNHTKNPNEVAINLNQFIEVCGRKHLRYFNDLVSLRRELKKSKKYKYINSNFSIRSQILKKNIKCWVFKKPEVKNQKN